GAMAHIGLEAEIITTAQGDEEYFHPEGTTVEMFQRGPLGWWGYAPHLAPAIKKAVRRVDLVHIHGLWLYPHLVAARAAARACTPYIVSLHGMLDLWALDHKRFRKRIYACLIERRTLREAAAVHAVSDHEVIDAKRFRLTRPVFIVPNGIDACEFANLPERSTLSIR